MKYFLLTMFLYAGLLFFITSCDDTLQPDEPAIDIPDRNVSYSQHIQPIFDYHCTSSGCHNDSERAGGLSLTSHANTTADPLIVFKGQPENSRLAQVIQPGAANMMPPEGYPNLTADQINGIATWIREGAKLN